MYPIIITGARRTHTWGKPFSPPFRDGEEYFRSDLFSFRSYFRPIFSFGSSSDFLSQKDGYWIPSFLICFFLTRTLFSCQASSKAFFVLPFSKLSGYGAWEETSWAEWYCFLGRNIFRFLSLLTFVLSISFDLFFIWPQCLDAISSYRREFFKGYLSDYIQNYEQKCSDEKKALADKEDEALSKYLLETGSNFPSCSEKKERKKERNSIFIFLYLSIS